MTQEEFNQQYMHYYLGSELIVFTDTEQPLRVSPPTYKILLDKGEKGIGAVKMILKDLADMSEVECRRLAQMGETREVLGIHMDTLKMGFLYATHSRKDTWLSFDELNPKQFDYLLKKGYNLFDPDWKFTIKAE